MTSSPRIVTSRFISYKADSITRKASVVVTVLDEFLGEPPRAALRVLLKQMPRIIPVTNPSGHHIFFEIANGTYSLIVEPDPVNADWYFLRPAGTESWGTGFERSITLPAQTAPLIVNIALTPKPSYPFPPATTLLLGTVTRAAATGPAVPLAVVRTSYERAKKDDPDLNERVDLETTTDAAGYFVLFFHSLPARIQTITVTAELQSSSDSKTLQITEGETTNTALVLP